MGRYYATGLRRRHGRGERNVLHKGKTRKEKRLWMCGKVALYKEKSPAPFCVASALPLPNTGSALSCSLALAFRGPSKSSCTVATPYTLHSALSMSAHVCNVSNKKQPPSFSRVVLRPGQNRLHLSLLYMLNQRIHHRQMGNVAWIVLGLGGPPTDLDLLDPTSSNLDL